MGKNRNAYNNAWEVFSARKEHYWSDITQSGYGCSSGTCWCLRYAGIITANESFHAAGNNEGVLADSTRFEKIKFSSDKVQPMDILVKWGVHVATWAGDGYNSLYECAPEGTHSVATNGVGCGLHRGHTLYNCGTGSVDWDYIYRIKEDDDMSKYTQEIIEKAVQWAINTAADNTHGYNNTVGKNLGYPDYDCGAFVSAAYRSAGVLPSGTVFEPNTYSGTAWSYNDILTAAGFVKYSYNANTVKRGDILIKDGRHTELAIGNGQQVGAHSDKDGKTGDSTGNEISVVNLYSGYWDYMYRLPVDTEVTYPELSYGSNGSSVKELQTLLNKNGATLEIDGSFGPATKAAVIAYQTAKGLYIDGIVGAQTWAALLAENTDPEYPELTPAELLQAASDACNGKYKSDTDHHKAKLKELYGDVQTQKIQALINLAHN